MNKLISSIMHLDERLGQLSKERHLNLLLPRRALQCVLQYLPKRLHLYVLTLIQVLVHKELVVQRLQHLLQLRLDHEYVLLYRLVPRLLPLSQMDQTPQGNSLMPLMHLIQQLTLLNEVNAWLLILKHMRQLSYRISTHL